ncbi:DUF6504 family protein [Serinicoccus kebangsaanensis]|uniref:DUF6504 family protein n=1 Tax=Serinicoccus kebangsaanensis TaxID=2602069 RepID=UPI00192D35F1|nr:DUF6504 family protein [Serinicoccus kebangsaanensis]
MSRSYHEPVEMKVGAAEEHGVRWEGAVPVSPAGECPQVPTVFLWRGRPHLVRAVLDRWTVRVPWWRSEQPQVEQGATVDAVEGEVDGQLERVVWRVEASAGRTSGTGVYDLVQGEQWWLDRVAD